MSIRMGVSIRFRRGCDCDEDGCVYLFENMKGTEHMKKHRRFTKQISDGFVARKALTYWRNMS